MNRFAEQVESEVISNKRVGAYHHMVLSVGRIAANFRPGNFIAIAVVNEISYGEGHGKSKREAEQVAARLAYEAIVQAQQSDA